jgi:hypothetical protein
MPSRRRAAIHARRNGRSPNWSGCSGCAIPRKKDWIAYKANEQETCAVIAEALGEKLGLPFEAEDISKRVSSSFTIGWAAMCRT